MVSVGLNSHCGVMSRSHTVNKSVTFGARQPVVDPKIQAEDELVRRMKSPLTRFLLGISTPKAASRELSAGDAQLLKAMKSPLGRFFSGTRTAGSSVDDILYRNQFRRNNFYGGRGNGTVAKALIAVAGIVAGAVAFAALANDAAEKSAAKGENPLDPTHIVMGRLSDAEVAQVNKDGKLPSNAKISYDCSTTTSCDSDGNNCTSSTSCDWVIHNNLLGITNGTRIIPAGHEIKNNCLGFTQVVPIGTTGICME